MENNTMSPEVFESDSNFNIVVNNVHQSAFAVSFSKSQDLISIPFSISPKLQILNNFPYAVDLNYMVLNSYRLTRKEDFYVTAIKNLRKKINFIRLNYEFQNGNVSDEEFDSELEVHPEKYIVNVSILDNNADAEILDEVINRIDDGFMVDDITDIFSVDISGYTKE